MPVRLRWNMLTRCSDDEDEAAELMRELEKIKRERLEQKEKEVGFICSCGFLPYSPISRNANVLQRKRSNESMTLPGATRCSIPRTSISSGDGTTTLSSRIKLAGPKRNGERSLSM